MGTGSLIHIDKGKAGTRADILGSRFPLFVSPYYYILQAVRRGGLIWRLYTEIQTKRRLYRKSYVFLYPKAHEVERSAKTYCSIDSQFTTTRNEQTHIIGTAPTRRRFPHIYVWLVVSRESYGECLRLFR